MQSWIDGRLWQTKTKIECNFPSGRVISDYWANIRVPPKQKSLVQNSTKRNDLFVCLFVLMHSKKDSRFESLAHVLANTIKHSYIGSFYPCLIIFVAYIMHTHYHRGRIQQNQSTSFDVIMYVVAGKAIPLSQIPCVKKLF